MRILVTGGLGFIGHGVVKMLEDLGQEVIVTDTCEIYPPSDQTEMNTLIKMRSSKFKNATIYNVSINNCKSIFEIHKPEIVINFASPSRQQIVNLNPALYSETMSAGLLSLLELSAQHEIKKFVHISSSMVYGNFANNTIESAACNPIGQYGIMKLASEMLVRDYSRRCGFPHTIVRPSAVYGPYDVKNRVVAKFFYAALLNGVLEVNGPEEKLDFTYIDDLVPGIVAATRSPAANNKTYNLTRGNGRSLIDAARLVHKIVGKGSIVIKDKDKHFPSRGSLNIDAARKDFDFDPKIDIETGFERYHTWLIQD